MYYYKGLSIKKNKHERQGKIYHGHGKHGGHHGRYSFRQSQFKKEKETDGHQNGVEFSMHEGFKERSNGSKARVDVERCIGCGKCVRACPEDAIHLSESGGSSFQVPLNDPETESPPTA